MTTKIGFTKRMGATLLAGACAYVATLSLIGGMEQAGAVTLKEMVSSACHPAFDDNGATVNNSGALTYTGTGTKSIYCPVVSDGAQYASDVSGIVVHGSEGTNGASSRTCSCYLNPVECFCSTGRSWGNNAGVVATDLSTTEWTNNQQIEYNYILHIMTQNSTLAGMNLVGN